MRGFSLHLTLVRDETDPVTVSPPPTVRATPRSCDRSPYSLILEGVHYCTRTGP